MLADVRFGSKADITALQRGVRFTPESGHPAIGLQCPLSANRVTSRRSKTNSDFSLLGCSWAGFDLGLAQQTSEVPNSFGKLQNLRFAKLVDLLM